MSGICNFVISYNKDLMLYLKQRSQGLGSHYAKAVKSLYFIFKNWSG